jgi:hypothetical protein
MDPIVFPEDGPDPSLWQLYSAVMNRHRAPVELPRHNRHWLATWGLVG